MNLKTNAIAAAVVLGLSGGAHAATIDDASANGASSDFLVMIKKGASDSLLINTNLSTLDIINGAASFQSDAGLTAAIAGFIGAGSDVSFWGFGAFKNSNFDFSTVTTRNIQFSQTLNQDALNAFNIYAERANSGAFGNDDMGDGPDIENVTGNADLDWNNSFVNDFVNPGIPLGNAATLQVTNTNFFGGGTTNFEAPLLLSLAGDGSLAVAPVPVPAAVWLFGSALLGLAGAARRRGARV